jgi:hypothetical protein
VHISDELLSQHDFQISVSWWAGWLSHSEKNKMIFFLIPNPKAAFDWTWDSKVQIMIDYKLNDFI